MKEPRLTKKKKEDLTLEQGIKVHQTINTPGWEVIAEVIRVSKFKCELERKGKLVSDPNGSKALYFSGKIDGAQEVMDNIFTVVQEAINMKESQKLMKEYDHESL